MNNDELQAKIKAQYEYCKEKRLPNFTPVNGICWNCHNNIYERITLEQAGSDLISGCPICHYSFCE